MINDKNDGRNVQNILGNVLFGGRNVKNKTGNMKNNLRNDKLYSNV